MPQRKLFFWFLASFALACSSGCGPENGTFTPPPPLVTITDVASPTPNIGDEVTITWKYSTDDDPSITPKMKQQIVQMHSLTFDGNIFTETQGCLPDELLNGQQPLQCMDTSLRAIHFTFAGPVMFDLIVVDDTGTIIDKLVKFKIKGSSFRIDGNTSGFLNGDINSSPTGNLPRVGGDAAFGDMEFERAFGIFEVAAEDPVIDQLQQAPLNQFFDTDNPFMLTMTPDINEHVQTGLAFFVSTKGRNFPTLESEFLFNTPDGAQFQATRTHADALLFAGTLTASGTVEKVEGKDGDFEVITPTLRSYEPVFLQIDIRSTDTSPQQFIISDVHFGNTKQGLVLSAFRFHIATQRRGTRGQFTHTIDTSAIPLLSSGSIKGAVTGFNVHLSNGQDFAPAQATISAQWSNIPMFPDNDISGLRSTYIRFSQ